MSRFPDPPEPDEAAPEPERPARDRRRLRGFLNHLIGYFLVMIVLVPVNALVSPGTPWFLLPMVLWGAPLALHAAYAMGWFDRRR